MLRRTPAAAPAALDPAVTAPAALDPAVTALAAPGSAVTAPAAPGSAVTALAALGLAVAAALLPAAPARAADVFVEVTPATVDAGGVVGLRASCPDNPESAKVESPAFGEVDLRRQANVLTAAVAVPRDQYSGVYRVRLTCPNGRMASTELTVNGQAPPSRGPATGFGGTADRGSGPRLLVTGGIAAMAAGLGLGLVALRRRRAG